MTTFTTAFVWIALITALILVSRKFARQTRMIATATAVALIAVQSVGLASLIVDPDVLTGGKRKPNRSPSPRTVCRAIDRKQRRGIVLDTYDHGRPEERPQG